MEKVDKYDSADTASAAVTTVVLEEEAMVDAAAPPMHVPKRIFIVPYRNRPQQKFFFAKYMSFLLEHHTDYEIYFAHQCDARSFNRGAVKNLGFWAMRDKYPAHYRDITFVFNDVDTIPFHKLFDYQTTPGVVKHYYGFKHTLGGIVVMKGVDFERVNGFPCYWGWGMEDNALQTRCERAGITIDRSVFYGIGSPEILQLFDGISRIISRKDPWRSEHDDGVDGLRTLHDVVYDIDTLSPNPHDNLYTVPNDRVFYINVRTFLTQVPFGSEDYIQYDLREPPRKVVHPNHLPRKQSTSVVAQTKDWSNIPYYPTTLEARENVVKYLEALGRPVPATMLQQLEDEKRRFQLGTRENQHLLPPPPPSSSTLPPRGPPPTSSSSSSSSFSSSSSPPNLSFPQYVRQPVMAARRGGGPRVSKHWTNGVVR